MHTPSPTSSLESIPSFSELESDLESPVLFGNPMFSNGGKVLDDCAKTIAPAAFSTEIGGQLPPDSSVNAFLDTTLSSFNANELILQLEAAAQDLPGTIPPEPQEVQLESWQGDFGFMIVGSGEEGVGLEPYVIPKEPELLNPIMPQIPPSEPPVPPVVESPTTIVPDDIDVSGAAPCAPPSPPSKSQKGSRKPKKPKLHEIDDPNDPLVQRAKKAKIYRTNKKEENKSRIQTLENRVAELESEKRRDEASRALNRDDSVKLIGKIASAVKKAGGGTVIVSERLALKRGYDLTEEEVTEIADKAGIRRKRCRIILMDLDSDGKGIIADECGDGE